MFILKIISKLIRWSIFKLLLYVLFFFFNCFVSNLDCNFYNTKKSNFSTDNAKKYAGGWSADFKSGGCNDEYGGDIEVLIDQLKKGTTITTYQTGGYCLPQAISKAIIEQMKDKWDKNNIHILTLLPPLCNSIAQINSLMGLKKVLLYLICRRNIVFKID